MSATDSTKAEALNLGVRSKLFFVLLGLIAATVVLVDIYSTNALDRLLTETEARDWPGQVRWLSDWRAE